MQKSRSNRRITDLGHGHHLSPDGMSVTKDGEPGVLSKILETDKSVFFQGGDRNAILWTILLPKRDASTPSKPSSQERESERPTRAAMFALTCQSSRMPSGGSRPR